jgi:hypothetical protein
MVSGRSPMGTEAIHLLGLSINKQVPHKSIVRVFRPWQAWIGRRTGGFHGSSDKPVPCTGGPAKIVGRMLDARAVPVSGWGSALRYKGTLDWVLFRVYEPR